MNVCSCYLATKCYLLYTFNLFSVIKCPELKNDFQFTRLNIMCTNSRAYGSECQFDCEPGFNIDGPESITCGAPTMGNVGTWDDVMPLCLSKLHMLYPSSYCLCKFSKVSHHRI